MISRISFGSTYKVSSKANGFDKFWDFQDYANRKEMSDNISTLFRDSFAVKTQQYEATYSMVVPDSMDYEIETFCANKGIKFQKLNTKDLMETKSILKRIEDAPRGMKKKNVDVEKLFELAKNQQENISHCKSDYLGYYKGRVDLMFKSGDEIPATTLWIHPADGDVDGAVEYIKRYGADNLNDNQLFVEFNQTTDAPDHCTLFALKNMGVKEVPVYVNEETNKIAKALGILK